MPRAAKALSLLRGSRQAAGKRMAKPLSPRAGRTSCARFRRNKYRQQKPQRQRHNGAPASHLSDEQMRDSCSGMPATLSSVFSVIVALQAHCNHQRCSKVPALQSPRIYVVLATYARHQSSIEPVGAACCHLR